MKIFRIGLAFVACMTIAFAAQAQATFGPQARPPPSAGPVANWQLVRSGPVDLAAGLDETLWNTAVAPYGPFDFIGLHRLRSRNVPANGKVVLFLPGAQASGVLYTNDERYDFRIYLANRGYDVYSLDYRTHFIPPFGLSPTLQPLDLSSMNNWNGAAYVNDVTLAVELALATSGVPRLYLAAFSSGNEFMYYYATIWGRQKLIGLIGMDGGPWQVGSLARPSTVDFARGRQALVKGDTPGTRALLESWNIPPGKGVQFASGNMIPDLSKLPPPPPGVDLLTSTLQNLWGYGQLTNIENGYNSLPQLLPFMALATDDFWPNIQTLEDVTTSNWSGHPPTLHYLDGFSQVDLPMIIFGSGMLDSFDYTQMAWKFLATTLTSTTDAQTHLLTGFGHLDVLTGTYARDRVFVPMELWLQQH